MVSTFGGSSLVLRSDGPLEDFKYRWNMSEWRETQSEVQNKNYFMDNFVVWISILKFEK